MAGFRIDRNRAARVAAAFGLALLVISILPGLLRPPPPPELPADVGFAPAETADLPIRVPATRPENPSKSKGSDQAGIGKGGSREEGRQKQRRRNRARPAGPADASPGAPAPAPGTLRPSTPSAALAPSAAAPPVYVAPAPPPAPPAPQTPADGSQEFAPR